MNLKVRAYVGLVTAAAVLLALADYSTWASYARGWPLGLVLGLVAGGAVGEHVSFRVHSGWTTHAGTVPHLATALLLPPGQAAVVAGLGMVIYVVHRRMPPIRAIFNTASVMVRSEERRVGE